MAWHIPEVAHPQLYIQWGAMEIESASSREGERQAERTQKLAQASMEGDHETLSFSQKYFWPLALAQFSYLFGLTALHSIGWFHYLLDERMDLELIYVGGYLYLTCTTFTQLFVSHYMDNMHTTTASRIGRRKPFIFIG